MITERISMIKRIGYIASLYVLGCCGQAEANEALIADCAELVQAYTGQNINTLSGEYSDPFIGAPRVKFDAFEIECKFDRDGLISDLTVKDQVFLEDGWPNSEVGKRYEALLNFADREHYRLDKFGWAINMHASAVLEDARKLSGAKQEADKRLKRAFQVPGADYYALAEKYESELSAPTLAELELGFRVAMKVSFDEYELNTEDLVVTDFSKTDEAPPECKKLSDAYKKRPDRSNYVSEYEDVDRLLKLASPILKLGGWEITPKHQSVALALILSGAFKKQAADAEAENDPLAHERAAYEWGYAVGDPETIRLIRFFSEGVQLGFFGANTLEPLMGDSAKYLDKIQDAIGGNGKTYNIDLDYLEDAFGDVQISKDGAIEGQHGQRSGLRFLDYWKRKYRC